MEATGLIIGAGVAGPATAIALGRAGIDAVVYEAHPLPRDDSGAFLNVAPNGINVLRALDPRLPAMLEAAGFTNDNLVFHTETGRVLAQVPVGGVTIPRGALCRTLREVAGEAGVRFEFGKRLESVEAEDGGVVARFVDGSTAAGRFVIGADGIHSRTRMSAFPGAPRPAYSRMINIGGRAMTDLPSTGTGMHMVFGHLGFFGYAVRPTGETYWFSNFALREEPPRGSLDVINPAEWRERLLSIHRDDPPEVIRILRGVGQDIGAYVVYDLPSLRDWCRGPVCLVGDAAHAIGPHTGQGASLAMEDAFVLAKCLRGVADPEAAFEVFERTRKERVERIARHSRRTGRQKTPTGALGRKIRDWILPAFLKRGAEAAQRVYSFSADWDEPVSADRAHGR